MVGTPSLIGARRKRADHSNSPTRHSVCIRQGTQHEALPPPMIVNCHNERSFVGEAVNLIMQQIRDQLLIVDDGDMEQWSGRVALVGLSGGSTPIPIYESLSSYMRDDSGSQFDWWTKVIFFLVDERYVPEDSPESNTAMIKNTLLKNSVVPPENFMYPNTSLPIEECVDDYDRRLADLFALSRPTLVILGLGSDGHLASWFPPLSARDTMSAYDPFQLVAHTTQDRFSCKDRVTVSMHLLLCAKHKIFLLKGEDKIDVYRTLTKSAPTREAIRQQPLLQVLRSKNVGIVTFPPLDTDPITELHLEWTKCGKHLTLVLVGASGDLAVKKTFPALFSLYCAGYLPSGLHIAGYARSISTLDALLEKIKPRLSSINQHFAIKNKREEEAQFQNFASLISVHKCKSYEDADDAASLHQYLINEVESGFAKHNRVFYLAVPPDIFSITVATMRQNCWSTNGWNRFIVEKPFGRDSKSSQELSEKLAESIDEKDTYRIDHYLGKEMVLNLLIIRFANVFLSPLWNRHCIKCVRITWKETSSTEGRGGYFDRYGIIRDVIQNHLLQILCLVAMERPVTLNDEDIRDEKVKVLRSIKPLELKDCVIGQYTQNESLGISDYVKESKVPPDSITPTFATVVLKVANERWSGVPFIMKAGKALEKQIAEVRIQLRDVSANLFGGQIPPNELVIRIQPKDAIYLKCIGKQPGLTEQLVESELDLSIWERFKVERINDAYERLLLDVIRGDKKNFVRADELREAWRICTPLLDKLEQEKVKPLLYQAGSNGPKASYDLIRSCGYSFNETYSWTKNE